MGNTTSLRYEDCTVGANEPLDKYTINRVFRRCYEVSKDRVSRLLDIRESPPYAASEDAVGVVRFVDEYKDSGQRALSPAHVLNLSSFMQYADKVVRVSDKCMETATDEGEVYTVLNETSVNTLPNGIKMLTGSFVVGFNRLDLNKLIGDNEGKYVDVDGPDKDAFYSTRLQSGQSVVYVPYVDRARMDEYKADPHPAYTGRGPLSEDVFERRMKAIRVTSDVGGERNRYLVESLFSLSFSIQDFVTYCDLRDVGNEGGAPEWKHGEAELVGGTEVDYPGRFYFYRRPVILVQAVVVDPSFNRFNRDVGRNGERVDLEEPLRSGADSSVYVPPRTTAFVENFSCDYDANKDSDMVGSVVNNNLTIGLSSRFFVGDDRDNAGFASASKLNHKVKVTFMLMGV